MKLPTKLALTSATAFSLLSPASGIMITVDYRYDTNNFFDTADKRAAMQRAADRWSTVLADGQLGATSIDNNNDGRIGFSHPGTGANFEVSGASNPGSDSLVNAGASQADEYRAITFSADAWVLYAGGRDIGFSGGEGGTGSGTNFTSTFDDPNSHLNRGFNSGVGSLPVWGGSITFDSVASRTTWDFTDDASGSGVDFYSIALHEIGHSLGLATSFDDFTANQSGTIFTGANTVAAFNEDNGTNVTSLNLESLENRHFLDQDAQSIIFAAGNPDYDGTVGEGNLQDLIMDPTANFSASVDRLELTNVDVGSAQDIGWQVIPEPSSTALLGFGSFFLLLKRRK